MTEREALRQAIEWARNRYEHGTVPERFHFWHLADAAEKYLAFLPAPVWKVRVWWAEGAEPELFLKDTHGDAFAGASSALMAGASKVEIEKP